MSALPEIVADEEVLARFLFQSNQFKKDHVLSTAFMPNPKDGETSVSRHGAEPRERLWELGALASGTRTLYGAAFITARDVRNVLLEINAAEPPPFHAVIIGWYRNDADKAEEKARQKEIALDLASRAGAPLLK